MMVARPKLVDVACDGPGDVVCRLPDVTVKLG